MQCVCRLKPVDGRGVGLLGPAFTVTEGAPTQVDAELRLARCLVVLGPDGIPVCGVDSSVEIGTRRHPVDCAPTDVAEAAHVDHDQTTAWWSEPPR